MLSLREKIRRLIRRQAGLLDVLYTSTLFTTLAVVQPTTIAIIQYQISLAIARVEGDISTECLMFSGGIAMACLIVTSEISIWTSTVFLCDTRYQLSCSSG